MNCVRPIFAALSLLLGAAIANAQAAPDAGPTANLRPAVLQNVGFEPPLNGRLPLELPFRDETGRAIQLREYFAQKPVVLAFVYYGCPMLCDQLEQGVVGSLRMLSFTPGRDYEVVFVSFDDSEAPSMAAQKKASAMTHFRRPETAGGWHFLTGSKDSIAALAKAANFRFSYDEKNHLFAHATGMLLLTPDGRISRYFYGVEFPARDLRLGLVDASAGKIGSPIDHVLLFCFRYDPTTARYSASILKIMRLGAIFTVLALVSSMLIFRRRDVAAARMKSQGAH